METLKLKAEKREEIGGLAPKKAIYKDNKVPGIIYGGKDQPQPIYVQKNELLKIISNEGRDVKLKADLESEKVIKEYLLANSNFPILAEESGANQDLGNSFWVVDPLDGTTNFAAGIPYWSISVSYTHLRAHET